LTPTTPPCGSYPPGGFIASKDTWIGTNQDTSHASDPILRIRPNNGVDRRSLIEFDLTSIPPGSTITSATLYLFDLTGGNFTVNIYRITENWPETVNWSTQPAFNSTARGSFALTSSSCVRSAHIDPSLVQSWVNNPSNNNGLILYPPSGEGQTIFSSREGVTPPKLIVNFSTSSIQKSRSNIKSIKAVQLPTRTPTNIPKPRVTLTPTIIKLLQLQPTGTATPKAQPTRIYQTPIITPRFTPMPIRKGTPTPIVMPTVLPRITRSP
jgi:hypothetical protein